MGLQNTRVSLAGTAWALAAILCLIPWRARADAVVLEDGRTISGQITYEDDEKVEISTQQYGALTFQKYRIKEVQRPLGSTSYLPPAAPAATAAPGAAVANPFGAAPVPGEPSVPAGPSTAAPNPFGSGPSAPAAPAVSAQPNPFGPGSSVPAPGSPEAVGVPTPGPGGIAEAPTPVPTIPPLPSALEEPAPPIPAGSDGVLYGIDQGNVVEIRRGEQEGWTAAANNTALAVGNSVRTGEGKAKIRLRGRDTLRMPPRSQIVLVALSNDASQVTIEVRNGSLWTEVAPRARAADFQVKTPDLTAGVRGTLFKTSVATGEGSRVAVLEDTVEVTSVKTGEHTIVQQATAVTVNPAGQIAPPVPVMPKEYDEWAAWDQWAAETYQSLAPFSAVGAPIIQGIVNQAADDNARWAASMNESNRLIVMQKYEARLQYYADAFMKFAEDTGHIPDPDTEGWLVLRENKGNWPGWKGPYIQDTQVPPLDPFDKPVHYVVRWSRIGTIHGLVYSEGPNRHDDRGLPSSDDISAFAMFYRLPIIANNPQYQAPQPGAGPATPQEPARAPGLAPQANP